MKIRNLPSKEQTLNDLLPESIAQKNNNPTLPIEVFQPWSNIIVKLKLPQPIFEEMLEITDKLIVDKNAKDFSTSLVGKV